MAYYLQHADIQNGDFYMVIFELESLTKDFYLYLKSSGYEDNLSGGLFTEPVQVYSNINNGLGIWGAYSSSEMTFKRGVYPKDSVQYVYVYMPY